MRHRVAIDDDDLRVVTRAEGFKPAVAEVHKSITMGKDDASDASQLYFFHLSGELFALVVERAANILQPLIAAHTVGLALRLPTAQAEGLCIRTLLVLFSRLAPISRRGRRDPWPESKRNGMNLIGTLMLFLREAMYFETRKHDLVVKWTTSLFFVLYRKADMVSSTCLWTARLSFPSPRHGKLARLPSG